MKNSIIIILFLLFKNLYAENISIEANNISLEIMIAHRYLKMK